MAYPISSTVVYKKRCSSDRTACADETIISANQHLAVCTLLTSEEGYLQQIPAAGELKRPCPMASVTFSSVISLPVPTSTLVSHALGFLLPPYSPYSDLNTTNFQDQTPHGAWNFSSHSRLTICQVRGE